MATTHEVETRVTIDDGRFPIVRVTFPRILSDAALAELLNYLDQRTNRAEPFALLMDLQTLSSVTASQRHQIAQRVSTTSHAGQRNIRGCALLLRSPILRGVLTALQWLAPPPFPTKVFVEDRDGEQWCLAQLAPPAR